MPKQSKRWSALVYIDDDCQPQPLTAKEINAELLNCFGDIGAGLKCKVISLSDVGSSVGKRVAAQTKQEEGD